jgi:ribosome-associated protein
MPMPLTVDPAEVELSAIRAQGAGGQNVNKVSSAIHLRFDIGTSSLPEEVKARLLHLRDQRVTQEGVLVIKAQRYRTQEANRQDALKRLQEWVNLGAHVPRARKATKPTYASRQRRLEGKSLRGQTKSTRARVVD